MGDREAPRKSGIVEFSNGGRSRFPKITIERRVTLVASGGYHSITDISTVVRSAVTSAR